MCKKCDTFLNEVDSEVPIPLTWWEIQLLGFLLLLPSPTLGTCESPEVHLQSRLFRKAPLAIAPWVTAERHLSSSHISLEMRGSAATVPHTGSGIFTHLGPLSGAVLAWKA